MVNSSRPLRTCKKCGLIAYTDEDLLLFKKRKGYPHGRANLCKQCNNKDTMKWYHKSFVYCPTKNREKKYKGKYGITIAEYNDMYTRQGGRCVICDEQYDTMVIDHNHTTGEVRELLCNNCNVGIGMLNEDVNRLLKSINYINKHRKI